MRKVLIIALGFVSLGVLAAPQVASADWTKRRVCNTNYWPDTPRQFEKCISGDGKKYGCKVELLSGARTRTCYDVDVLVPNNWSGASASGVNKIFSPSTNLKNK